MLYDGGCPLCMREVDFLRGRDAGKGNISFVDIDAADYSPATNAGIDFETAMGTIHAIRSDGEVLTGVRVFRELYDAVGLGFVYAVTRNPTVERLANKVYDFWAANRMAVTGRPDLSVILAEKKAASCRVDGACEIPAPAEGK